MEAESAETLGSEEEPDTRERLVRAAIEVFLEKGYGGTRVQDIAQRAGYTPGALYVHFPSRSALLGEAIVVEGQRIVSQLAESFSRVAPGGEDAARAMALFAVAESGPVDQLMLEALALAARDPGAREMFAKELSILADRMTEQVEVGVSMGIVDPNLDVAAVRTFFSAWTLGLIVHRAIGLSAADADDMSAVCSRMIAALSPR
jgi:AcrR family transcriptional regulator